MGSVETKANFETEMTLDTLFSVGQIRLAEISVFNWGSFHDLTTVKINRDGTLITGDNGSGKSTLIDGLMALLLPASKAQFNIAAALGDKADRSLLSYIRGTYGTGHDGNSTRVKNKRDGAVCTGLRALYLADDGSEITLTALFFVQKNGRKVRDIERMYIVAKRNLTLKELLDTLGNGEKRKLKYFLRNEPTLKLFDGSFSTYQEYYSKLLHMENRNAPNLLSRALGLKKIDDLTDLIRDLVLEPSEIKGDCRKIVDEFSDLVGIHNELQDANEQSEALKDLTEVRESFLSAEKNAENTKTLLDNVPVYIGEASSFLWKERVQQLQKGIDNNEIILKRQSGKKGIAEELRDRCYKDYIEGGGNRIEEVKKDLKNTRKEYAAINSRASTYQDVAKNLGLDESLKEQTFTQNKHEAQKSLDQIEGSSDNVQDRFGDLRGQLTNLANEQRYLKTDIYDIEKRKDSAIDPAFQRLKQELIDSLGVNPDDFVFIGELINVKDSEKQWQGAIERAVGGRSTTLLVPAASRSMVSKWLNARHTGLFVRIEEVRGTKSSLASFKSHGYLKKLEWKEHPYRDWLKHNLARFDLGCVDSTFELDASEFSMTKEGLIRKERGRLEKNDSRDINNERFWNIGFSNKSRLDKLKIELVKLDEDIKEVNKKSNEARNEWNQLSERKSNFEKLVATNWEEIDVQYSHDLIETYEQEIEELESTDNGLHELEMQHVAAKTQVEQVDSDILKTSNEGALLKSKHQEANQSWEDAKEAASKGLEDWVRIDLSRHVGPLTIKQLPDIHNVISGVSNKLQSALDKENERKGRFDREAARIMSHYRGHEKWRVIAEDWGSDIECTEQYIEHYRYLIDDGLPELNDKFMTKLNQDSTQSLASLRQRLQSEHEDIRDRIDTINKVLYKTEFRNGTYLKLVGQRDDYAHVKVFNQKVTSVLAQATTSDSFKRFTAASEVIAIIEKASILSPNTLESQQLLDPRHQLCFIAEEIRREDGVLIDTLNSSSGKSGGEKESFAGMIVAASLAYVLTPDGYDKPVYSTVFLDEAFSNTSEAVSRRVLKVFNELNLHINLITPYKNLNIARESASSLLIAERNADTHESRFLEMTWEEVDQHLEDLEKRKELKEAEGLGIEVEEV